MPLHTEVEKKLTVWACTSQGFTVGQLIGQALLCRVEPGEQVKLARVLISKWKKEDKISFSRGRWKWKVKK